MKQETKKYFEEKSKNNNGIHIDGVLYDGDEKLNSSQIEDLLFDFLESLGLEFGGGIDYIDINSDN